MAAAVYREEEVLVGKVVELGLEEKLLCCVEVEKLLLSEQGEGS